MTATLVHVHPLADRGLHRVASADGFSYADADGRPVSEADATRIRALVIPPAWTDVWISANADGHIQAVGTDAAGRRQYLYHPAWTAGRATGKFARALALAGTLPRARGRVTAALRHEGLGRERVLATAFRILDTAAVRVGSARYLEQNGSRGLTTLQARDVIVHPPLLSFDFPGKSHKEQSLDVHDRDLAVAVAELADGRDDHTLLAYEGRGRRVALAPKDVNAYVHALTGGPFTAKDFRTLHGTILAAQALAHLGPVDTVAQRRKAEVLAVRAASAGLGNTPAVARASYIDPTVWARYETGLVLDLAHAPEHGIRMLLLGHADDVPEPHAT